MGLFSWLFSPKDEFLDRLLQFIKAHPRVRRSKHHSADQSIEVQLDDGTTGRCFYSNLRTEWSRASSSDRDRVLEGALDGIIGTQHPANFAAARPVIMPLIRTNDIASAGALSLRATAPQPGAPLKPANLVQRPMGDSLAIYYVIDSPRGMSYLSESDLTAWNISIAAVHEAALENLRRATPKPPSRIRDGIFGATFGDSYDASRALLADWMDRSGRPPDPLVAIPTREHLLMADAALAETLYALAEQLSTTEPRPISAQLYRPSVNGLERYQPDRRDPLARQAGRARALDAAQAYGPQKESLDAIFKQERVDIFVATLIVMDHPERGTRSITTWTEGAHSWLPFADLIGFVPDNRDMILVSWEEGMRIAGSHAKPVPDLVPHRIEVASFPTKAEFEALKAASQA